jgi:hypothetical protein
MFKGLIRGAIVVVIMWLSLASALVSTADVQQKPEATASQDTWFELFIFPVQNKWEFDKVEFHCVLNSRGQQAKKDGLPVAYEHLVLVSVVTYQGGIKKDVPGKELGNWKKRFRDIFPGTKSSLGSKIA